MRSERRLSLTLTLLLVTSALLPVPASAQGRHPEWMYEAVAELFKKFNFVEALREVLYPELKSPKGFEILNEFGGKDAVRKMLEGWGLTQKQIDEVIKGLATNARVNRKFDQKFAVRGLSFIHFYVEIKSRNDLSSNVVQTVREALCDAHLARKGEAVVWVTDGKPSSIWSQRVVDFLRTNNVGVATSLHDADKAREALDAMSRSAYRVPLGALIQTVKSKAKDVAEFFRSHPELAAGIALIGANVAVSLWEPSEPLQAELKAAIQDALRAIGMGYAAFVTVEGLVTLGTAIALGSGVGTAIAALSLVPTIAARAYAAATGQQPSPRVYAVEREIEGMRVRVVVIDPPDPLAPRKVVVFVDGHPRLAASLGRGPLRASTIEVAKSIFTFSRGEKSYSVGLGWDGVYAAVRWVVESSSRAGSCTVARRYLYERAWAVRYSEVVAGRNPQPQLRITLLGSSTTCRPQLQPQPQPQPQPPPARPSLTGGGLCCGRSIVDV